MKAIHLQRTIDGFASPCGRYTVECLRCEPAVSFSWAWHAVDTQTGEKHPCVSQKAARDMVKEWMTSEER